MNRIHVITLGVKNLKTSLRFYRDVMGFKASIAEDEPDIVFFQSEGVTLALYPREGIARDINEQNPPAGEGFGGITLAHIAASEEEVRRILGKAASGGGKIEKQPRRVFWGGYSGYFSDPDGYYWEVIYWEDWKFKPEQSEI